ncbi:MAG: hypothetical protein HYU52_14355 [Acidobacteria bacterium]|nr:hypothetical protein [Acidobacteriota bacterium]
MQKLLAGALCIACIAAPGRAQSIFTVAGGGSDEGRPATYATLIDPHDVAVGPDGDIYIADTDANRVRRVDADSGLIRTIAGDGGGEYRGDGGPAVGASLYRPKGVAVDSAGNVYIGDTTNFAVRKIDAATLKISTVAGKGDDTPADGVRATSAFLGFIGDVEVDAQGAFYFFARNRVWRVHPADGRLRLIAGNGEFGSGGDGGSALSASFGTVNGIAVDHVGAVFVADQTARRIRRIANGIVTTFAGGGSSRDDGVPATQAEIDVFDVCAGTGGEVYISDGRDRIRVVEPSGILRTIAGKAFSSGTTGDGGPASEARLTQPKGLAVDGVGNLLIVTSDFSYTPGFSFDETDPNRVRRIDRESGVITTIAGGTPPPSGEGGAAINATLSAPEGIDVDDAGNLFVAELQRHLVRRVDAATTRITTLAGTGKRGYNGDGIPAISADLFTPADVVVAPSGVFYISQNERIRRVGLDGIIETIAGTGREGDSGDGGPATSAQIENVRGMAFDAGGALLLADAHNHRIRRVDLESGIITTIAGVGTAGFAGDGGPATAARLSNPWGVAVDSAGNVFFADRGNSRVRRIDVVNGRISTVAGNGTAGYSGDGGPATLASLKCPADVAVDSEGTLYIADACVGRVRRVVNGTISTYAGSGSLSGSSGDAGPALSAAVGAPEALALDADGNLYIAQSDEIFQRFAIRYVPKCRALIAPTLSSPADGANGVSTVPRIAWSPVKGSFRYDVFVDTVSPPRVIAEANVTGGSFSPANLQPLTTYYWKVVAKGDLYCTPTRTSESAVRSFTTATSCAAPGQFSGQ